MNKLEIIMTVAIGILLLLIVVQWVVIVNQKKENDNSIKSLNWYQSRLDEYKIREESPIPMVKQIDYLILKEEVERYKPPYKVGQKVMYNDEGIVQVGYIVSVRTEQFMLVINDISELVVEHAYEIENDYFTDIIDVVKEGKE